jgi:hypothetical protein
MATKSTSADQSPDGVWDERLASDLPESIVLVGLTFVDCEDNLLRQEQFWGKVIRADRDAGIQLELRGANSGEDYWLPPDTRPLERAAPGEYRLRSSEETVTNPDFTAMWTITEPVQ